MVKRYNFEFDGSRIEFAERSNGEWVTHVAYERTEAELADLRERDVAAAKRYEDRIAARAWLTCPAWSNWRFCTLRHKLIQG